MYSYRQSLPSPHAFDPLSSSHQSVGHENAMPAGNPQKPMNGVNKTNYGQEMTALLLDDTPLTRECLSISLNLCDRGLHVLTATSVDDVQAMLNNDATPDVVLCHFGGLEPADPRYLAKLRDLIAALGRIPLIVLSDREDTGAVIEAFRAGVRGYIPTAVGLSVALEAIRLVGAGGTFIPTGFLQRMMQDPPSPSEARPRAADPVEANDRLNGLTPRQMSVLRCMREGKANKIIAHELGMCESTVKVHVRNILKKLGATNRTQAVYLTLNSPPAN